MASPSPVIPTATLRTPGQQELSIAQSAPEVSHVGVPSRVDTQTENSGARKAEPTGRGLVGGWGMAGRLRPPLQEGLGFQKQGAEVEGVARGG